MDITGNLAVAKEIIERLRDVRICLDTFVASPVKGLDSTLKGIDFKCKDLDKIKKAFDDARDPFGRQAFYYNGQYSSGKIFKELIRNMPDLLDVSFAATDGYGYREIRDMPLLPSLSTKFLPSKENSNFASRFGFDDEETLSFDVSSLHGALGKDKCNVHIDQIGFVVRGPSGAFLNPDFPQHLVNELGLQDKLAPYLGMGLGRILKATNILRSDQGEAIGNWISKNVSVKLPNFKNGYRPGVTLAIKPTPRLEVSVRYTAKCNFCKQQEQDFGIPIPDGSSIGVGFEYRFGKGGKK
jgi:hypothetical protein